MFWVLLVTLLLAGVTAFAYRSSAVRASSERAKSAVRAVELLRIDLRAQAEETKRGVQQAGTQIQASVRRERLQKLTVEEIKRHASGVRLQALRDAGLWSILDLQGKDAQRLNAIRGIGPKSANSIAYAVQQITQQSNKLPLASPRPPFQAESDRVLLQAIYRELQFESGMQAQKAALDSICSASAEKLAAILTEVSFTKWLLSVGRSPKLEQARASAEALTEELQTKPEMGMLLAELSSFLAEMRSVSMKQIDRNRLLEAYADASPLYDWMISKALGKKDTGPRPVEAGSATPTTTPLLVEKISENKEENLQYPKTPTEAIQEFNGLQARREERSQLEKEARPADVRTTSQAPSEELVSFQIGTADPETTLNFSLPKPAHVVAGKPQWIEPGEPVIIHGVSIACAFFHYGSADRTSDACIVDPFLPVKAGTLASLDEDDWSSSYVAFSPHKRYLYLRWLASGVIDEPRPYGYALIYFMGLQRRALELFQGDDSGAIDRVIAEIERVEPLFRGGRDSISYNAFRLLDFLAAKALIDAPVPALSSHYAKSNQLPFELRIGLGAFLRDKQPIPVEWALRWACTEPTIYLRTAAVRCNVEFEAAFRHLYQEKYGQGLVVKPNKTMLSVTYQPSWMGGGYEPAMHLDVPGIPDVAALTAPQTILHDLVEKATDMVDAYSRFLGPTEARAGTLEALLLLPPVLWQEEAKEKFDRFRTDFVEGMSTRTCKELFAILGCTDEITAHRVTEVARGLRRFHIGFEPNVLAGSRRPKADDPIVLFPLSEEVSEEKLSEDWPGASLFVELAAVLTLADGHASEVEAATVDGVVSAWAGLNIDQQSRLKASYRLSVRQPPTLAALKVRLAALGMHDRRQVVSALSTLAASDGVVSPEEVKLLERLYKMLTLETSELYASLHGSAGGAQRSTTATRSSLAERRGLSTLDPSRIAELRRESSQVSQLLAEVFLEEEAVAAIPLPSPPPVQAEVEGDTVIHLAELKPADSRFLKVLLGKDEWRREELLQIAEQMQIMLDGTLERINDAVLDSLGDVLIEGDDPIFVQQNLMETAE